VTATDRL